MNTSAAATPLLEFRNLTVIKGRNRRILNGISVTVHEGENMAILGPNGAGKSSFIKTITREYYPIPGTRGFCFRIFGRRGWDVFELRSLLGIVSTDLQRECTLPISGMEAVLSGFFSSTGINSNNLVTREMRRKAEETLGFLEIAYLKDRTMNEMSTGEARRVLIARALVHDPKALILDEPATSLDLHALSLLRKTLRTIARSGRSIILVTQNLQDIIPEIGRVILMKDGRFHYDGPKDPALTAANITGLFDVPVKVLKRDGYYYAFGY
jgi:iron complex transport system ATP-binding protein